MENKIDSHELAHLARLTRQIEIVQAAYDGHMLFLSAKYKLVDGCLIDTQTGEIKRKSDEPTISA